MTDLQQGLAYQGLPMPRRLIAIAAISAGSMLLMIDTSIAGVVLPTIAKSLNVDSASTVLVVTVYQLILAMTLMPFAALGDRIGHRRLYQAGLIVHFAAAIMAYFADNLPALIFVRSLQALGSAAAMSVSVGLLRAIYPVARLGGGLGINTIFNATGTALGPVIGGFILAMASWHWAFTAVIPLSVISLILSRALPDPIPRKQPFDYIGAGLCALRFALVIIGLESAVHTPYILMSSGIVLCGALVAWFFVRYEKNQTQPVLPLDVLRLRVVAMSLISCMCAMLGSISLMLFMPFRLQHGFGFQPGQIGGLMAAYAIASVMVAPAAGYLSDRIPVALLSMIGMIVASIGLCSIAWIPDNPTRFDIAFRMWLCGAGFGMFFSPNARLIVGSAPVSRTAAAGSLFTTTRMLGQALGATMVAALFAMNLGDGPVPAFVATSLAAAAGVISAYSLLAEKRKSAAEIT